MYVEIKDINKKFANYQASNQVSFSIEKGKLIGLLGPSGSGKTTLLRMIAGLETPDSGEIYMNGQKINHLSASERGIGFVFQNYALFQHMNIFDNIAFGMRMKKQSTQEIKASVDALINLIGLKGLEKRKPHELSGGQKQRVAFARALAPKPQLLLLDEPFAAIDAKVRQELRSWLREMIETLGITSIFVTHDQEEAIEIADEIIIMNNGCVEQKSTPIILYKEPKTPFVAQFMGKSSVFENFYDFKGFTTHKENQKVVIRPEFVTLYKNTEVQSYPLAAEDGLVKNVSFRGSHQYIEVEVHDITIATERPLEKPTLEKGEAVKVLISRLYTFNNNETILLENQNLLQQDSIYL